MDLSQPGMDEIMRAVGALQSGERESAREQLLRLWEEWSPRQAPLQQSVITHFLADTEENAEAELQWDLRSLCAATGSDGASANDPVDPSLRGFLPSIHLNVGDAYRRLGDLERARLHAEIGFTHVDGLEEGDYRNMILLGLERLRARAGDA